MIKNNYRFQKDKEIWLNVDINNYYEKDKEIDELYDSLFVPNTAKIILKK